MCPRASDLRIFNLCEAANCRYCFYAEAENHGRLVAPIHVKFGTAEGHVYS